MNSFNIDIDGMTEKGRKEEYQCEKYRIVKRQKKNIERKISEQKSIEKEKH